jgi:hypothetical protein
MNRSLINIRTLVLFLVICLTSLLPTFLVFANNCDFIWTQQCTSEISNSGQDMHRISGTITIHDYHEEWGEASYTIPMGYWNPQEGDQGVRWVCPNNSTADIGFGWQIIYENGAWHDVTESIAVHDRNGRPPEDPFWIPTYEEHSVMYGISIIVCRYLGRELDTYSVRWRDTRDERQTTPFQDFVIIPWEQITVVTNYYQLTVPLDYPAAQVVRSPWLRAIAGQPVHFTATAEPIYASSEVIDACTPDILNFQLHLRLTPIYGAAPEWDFAEREWAREPGTASGWEVTHTFNSSSYNLPLVSGPSLDGGSPLPSYPVTLTLSWLVEANRTWNDFRGATHETGWQVVDLTQYGYNTPYLVTNGARDVTPFPPGIPVQDLPDYFVPVPVIESQAILSAP